MGILLSDGISGLGVASAASEPFALAAVPFVIGGVDFGGRPTSPVVNRPVFCSIVEDWSDRERQKAVEVVEFFEQQGLFDSTNSRRFDKRLRDRGIALPNRPKTNPIKMYYI